MEYALRFEVYVDDLDAPPRHVTIFKVEASGQMSLAGSRDFGPFDTDLEVAQWVWRAVVSHIRAP